MSDGPGRGRFQFPRMLEDPRDTRIIELKNALRALVEASRAVLGKRRRYDMVHHELLQAIISGEEILGKGMK